MAAGIRFIEYGSDAYEQTVGLRDAILRKPLGLHFTEEQLAAESSQLHLACYDQKELIACLILVDQFPRVKMRQVAVQTELQGRGVGGKMIKFCDEWAAKKGFKAIYCHARVEAVPFYLKHGYQKQGEAFMEVGIPHFLMERVL